MQEPLIKRLLPHGLFGRSLLIIVVPLVMVQIVSAWVFYDRHWDEMARRLSGAVAGDIGTLVEFLQAYPGEENRDWIFALAATRMEIRAVFRDNEVLPNTPGRQSGSVDQALAYALRERVQKPFRIDTRTLDREVKIEIQTREGILEAYTPLKRLFSSTTYIFLLWMVGSALILFAVAVIFLRNQVKPVRRLAAAAEAFGKGREIAAFKPEGATEVRQAAAAFNRMRERIQRQIAQRTEMLAGVSHDLRTPLTRMKLELALMSPSEGAEELRKDVEEMETMVEGYLAFARGEGSEPPVPTKLADLVEELVAKFRRSNLAIDLHCEGRLELPLRPQAIRRCLSNLIANAARYGSHVSVRVGERAESAEILIDDDGPGIPADKREEVFKPFIRLDESRNPRTGGVGLGLTIARDIARGHGGDVVLEESPWAGLRVRVRLPL